MIEPHNEDNRPHNSVTILHHDKSSKKNLTTSTHHDKTTPPNEVITPHHDETRHVRITLQDTMKKPHNIMKELQHIMKKSHNLMIKNHIKKLWLSLRVYFCKKFWINTLKLSMAPCIHSCKKFKNLCYALDLGLCVL